MKRYVIEFKEFLKEYMIIGMALAFIMGAASKDLVKSLVDNLIMPFINPLLSAVNGWETATWTLGPIVLNVGKFLADFISFAILALVVFFIAKKILKEEKVKKK